MTFGSPILLISLVAVPVAAAGYVWLDRRRRIAADRWASPALMPNLLPDAPGLRRRIPSILLLGAATFLLVGFARPQRVTLEAKEGATVMLVVDVSGSMAATDVKPSRIGAANATLARFVNKLPKKYRVGVVVFSDHASMAAIPTYDRTKVVAALPTQAHAQGTALGDAVSLAVAAAKRAVGTGVESGRPPAVVLVISDGAANAGRITAAEASEQSRLAHVPVSTALVGTSEGVLLRKVAGGFTERIQVPPDPTVLQEVARSTGGHFYRATTPTALDGVTQDLGSRIIKKRHIQSLVPLASGIGLAVAAVAIALQAWWFRRLL